MYTNDQRLRERIQWLREMVPHIRPGKIVEYGCGSGFVLEFLASEFPDSLIVGIDRSAERLAAVAAKGLPNVLAVKADISHDIFPGCIFNTALFVGVLHEIFSGHGEVGVLDILRQARSALHGQGAVIIQDFLRPAPRFVEMSFKNEVAHSRFLRFAAEFRPRPIKYETIRDGVRLEIADAVEFLSKYHSQSEEDWNHEMDETHFFCTEDGFRDLSETCGFRIEAVTRLPASQNRLRDYGQDIAIDLRADYSWI